MTKSKDLVVKSNSLVEARYRLSIWESRVFAKMVTMIKKDDDDFTTYEMNIKEIMDFFGTKAHNDYERIKEVPEMLLKRTLRIPNVHKGKDVYDVYGFVSKVTIPRGEKSLTENSFIRMRFDPDLKPYLLELKSRFLKYDIKNVLRISSPHSIRIYELLKQFEGTGWRQIEIQELKEILGVEDKYKLYGHLKDRVLKQAQKDLGQYTDICFTYEEIKHGRKVLAIKFFIYPNEPSRKDKKPKKSKAKKKAPQQRTPKPKEAPLFEVKPEMVESQAVQAMVHEGISYDQAEKLFMQLGEADLMDEVRNAKTKANKKKGLQNKAGFILKLIQERDFQKVEVFKKEKKKLQEQKEQAKKKKLEHHKKMIEQLRAEYETERNNAVNDHLKDASKKEIASMLKELMQTKSNLYQRRSLDKLEREGKTEEARRIKYQLFAYRLDETLHTFDNYLANIYQYKIVDIGEGQTLSSVS